MKNLILIVVDFIIGAIEENIRYSIIHHEAKKGDVEAQKIVDEFDVVGQKIEDKFSNK